MDEKSGKRCFFVCEFAKNEQKNSEAPKNRQKMSRYFRAGKNEVQGASYTYIYICTLHLTQKFFIQDFAISKIHCNFEPEMDTE